MRRFRFGFVAGLVFLAAAAVGPVAAEQVSFIAVLNGGQETPPTDSNGFGVAYVTLETDSGELCTTLTYSGLTGDALVAHFHAPAPPRQNAAVVVDLSSALPSPVSVCSKDAPRGFFNDLLNGRAYLNVHTPQFPGGEIRGQVERVGRPPSPRERLRTLH
jgi:hypothetical protein